jgi:2-oxoisovalerate dehydrogenase E1 component
VLRDIPGLILAVPSDGAEAVGMLRECVRLARDEQRLVVFVEPIALYPMRDFLADKDGGWMRRYPAPGERVPFGQVAVQGEGRDLAIVTYGNGVYLSMQAQADLAAAGVQARVIDLRWLSPLPVEAMLQAVAGCARVMVVDECRRSGGPSEGIITALAGAGVNGVVRVVAEDSFIATGPAYAVTMPSRQSIVAAALSAGASGGSI